MENSLVKKDDNVSIELLLKTAIEKSISVETMEKLMIMRRELKEEASKESYYKSLSFFQKEIPTITKEKEVKGKDGKHRYNFATLDSIVSQVKGLLEKYGFSYTITTEQDEKSVKAICQAHHIDGYSMETAFKVPIDYEAYMSAPQKIASALTYAKRYAFCNAFGIMTGDADDDATTAESEKKTDNQKSKSGTAGQNAKPPAKQQPAPSKNPIADIAYSKLMPWVKEGLITEGDIKATVRLVAKRQAKLNELTKEQIEDVVKKCQKVVDMKKKNDLTHGTGFDPTPIDPNAIPEDGNVKEAEFYQEDQDGK